MIGRIFLKEWRENLVPFFLGAAFIAVVFGLFVTHHYRTALYGVGVYLMFFVPFMALLIGASGFQSEFKDKAWTYLLSRPIRKDVVWVTKFFSQASMILALLGLFLLLKAVMPSSARLIGDWNAPIEFLDLSSSALVIGLPLMAFIIAFSLSFLSEKPLITFVVSLVILFGLTVVVIPRYGAFLSNTYLRGYSPIFLSIMICVGFILASLLTFARSDLSQRRRATVRFISWLVLFLVLAFGLQAVIVGRGTLFSGRKTIFDFNSLKVEGKVFFESSREGIVEYDAKLDRVKPIGGSAEWMDPFSAGGDKLVYFEKGYRLGQLIHEEIRVIDLSTGSTTPVARFYGDDSPFRDWRSFSNCMISPHGDRVAFVAIPKSKMEANTIPVLFWLKTDGSDIRRLPLEFRGTAPFKFIGWLSSENSLVMLISQRNKQRVQSLARLNLDTGVVQAPAEASKISFLSISPNLETIAFTRGNVDGRGQLLLLDLKTLEIREVAQGPELYIWHSAWRDSGDRFAFNKRNDIFVYLREERKVVKACHVKRMGYPNSFTWADHEEKPTLIVSDEGRIKFLGPDFQQVKSVPLPEMLRYNLLWSVEGKLLISDYERGLWRLDFKTEEWKKVY